MKNVLFVEDDDNKVKGVLKFLNHKSADLPQLDIDVKRSYQTGLNAILENSYDLILLDMSMHNFDKTVNEPGGEFMQFAGEDILKEMIWNDILIPTIVVTQYDIIGDRVLKDLKDSWSKQFSEVYIGTVFYSVNETNWENDLFEFLIKSL